MQGNGLIKLKLKQNFIKRINYFFYKYNSPTVKIKFGDNISMKGNVRSKPNSTTFANKPIEIK